MFRREPHLHEHRYLYLYLYLYLGSEPTLCTRNLSRSDRLCVREFSDNDIGSNIALASYRHVRCMTPHAGDGDVKGCSKKLS